MEEYVLKDGKRLSVDEAVIDDAAALIDATKTAGTQSDNLLFGEGEFRVTEDQERETIRKMGQRDDAAMLVGKILGEIAGVAQVIPVGSVRRTRHRGRIAIMVLKEYWGTGVGTAMMNELLKFAEGVGLEQLELEVRSDNISGIGLYKKMGFSKVGVMPRYYKFESGYADADIMCCFL